MAADPLIYCLQEVTDYDQFERLCCDIMALNGYSAIEPLGGSKDKGRDAIYVDQTAQGETTLFAYSVREDWRKKLEEDASKIQKHGHLCQRLVFLCTAPFTATERDEAIEFVKKNAGYPQLIENDVLRHEKPGAEFAVMAAPTSLDVTGLNNAILTYYVSPSFVIFSNG